MMTQPAVASSLAWLPRHVAIIMDGNGRWAEDRGLARLEGHRAGAKVVRDITTYARELGVPFLTLYSFSKQNWRRAPFEVAGLMSLLEEYCRGERATLMQNGIRLTTIGQLRRLPSSTREALGQLCRETAGNQRMTLCLAVDYGGREEIVGACQQLVAKAAEGALRPKDVSEEAIAQALDTASMPDPDLLIRTSGELRVSNFLLWQLAYAEMHFTSVRWPEFTRAHFCEALADFGRRERRYGKSRATPPPTPTCTSVSQPAARERTAGVRKDRPHC